MAVVAEDAENVAAWRREEEPVEVGIEKSQRAWRLAAKLSVIKR
jgi:hypothetical protein